MLVIPLEYPLIGGEDLTALRLSIHAGSELPALNIGLCKAWGTQVLFLYPELFDNTLSADYGVFIQAYGGIFSDWLDDIALDGAVL